MAIKVKCPEFENHERWLVSYADMVTLLFAVFVVLYALNLSGAKQQDAAAGSMQESFNTPLEEIPSEQRVGPTEKGFGIFDHLKGNSPRAPVTPKFQAPTPPLKIIDSELNRVKTELEDRMYGPEKFRDPNKPGQDRIIEIQRSQNGFQIRLLARHFFDGGSHHIKKEALKEMNQVAKVLKDLGRPLVVEGHTDSLPPKAGTSNWDLSALRATSVVQYFISAQNFPPMKIAAAGYADQRPIHHNGTEAGRALNRRIEIHVRYDSENGTDPPQ